MLDLLVFAFAPETFLTSRKGRNKLAIWAKKVKRRDGRCQKCGGKQNLEAHHIIPKNIQPKLAFRVSNGSTLCEICHRTGDHAYHKIYGFKGDRKTFNKWLNTDFEGIRRRKESLALTYKIMFGLIAATAIIGWLILKKNGVV